MSRNWGYNKFDHAYKTPEVLVRDLIEVVSAGGNLLLDVGPTAQGTFPETAVTNLDAIGDWMKINGEAIYGTKPWLVRTEDASGLKQESPTATAGVPSAMKDAVNDATSSATAADIRFTAKADAVYVFARSWRLKQVEVVSFAKLGLVVRDVTLLGSEKALNWKQDKEKLAIDLPASAISSIPVYTFRIQTVKA